MKELRNAFELFCILFLSILRISQGTPLLPHNRNNVSHASPLFHYNHNNVTYASSVFQEKRDIQSTLALTDGNVKLGEMSCKKYVLKALLSDEIRLTAGKSQTSALLIVTSRSATRNIGRRESGYRVAKEEYLCTIVRMLCQYPWTAVGMLAGIQKLKTQYGIMIALKVEQKQHLLDLPDLIKWASKSEVQIIHRQRNGRQLHLKKEATLHG